MHEIIIQPNVLKEITQYLHKPYSSAVIVTNHTIAPLFANEIFQQIKIPCSIFAIPDGEQYKTIATALDCWNAFLQKGLDRKSLVIALGGGVITDLIGFVASTYMRGIDLIHVPTTLLAMVDASVGGKTGVNLPEGKNIVGTFYNPKLVVIDPNVLTTLPKREYCSGLAEVIKYGVIIDPELFEYLEENLENILLLQPEEIAHIIQTSVKIKSQIVTKDPFEADLRAILNFGHTFGHAIETATAYQKYLHGEAIAIGMSCAALVSQELGWLDQTSIDRLHTLLKRANLPIELPKIPVEHLLELMKKDKKSQGGKITLILAKGIGKVEKKEDIDPKLILHVLRKKQHG